MSNWWNIARNGVLEALDSVPWSSAGSYQLDFQGWYALGDEPGEIEISPTMITFYGVVQRGFMETQHDITLGASALDSPVQEGEIQIVLMLGSHSTNLELAFDAIWNKVIETLEDADLGRLTLSLQEFNLPAGQTQESDVTKGFRSQLGSFPYIVVA